MGLCGDETLRGEEHGMTIVRIALAKDAATLEERDLQRAILQSVVGTEAEPPYDDFDEEGALKALSLLLPQRNCSKCLKVHDPLKALLDFGLFPGSVDVVHDMGQRIARFRMIEGRPLINCAWGCS
eukprot:1161250-Amphidinium_carterae.1